MTGDSTRLDGSEAERLKAYFGQLKDLDDQQLDIAAAKRDVMASAKDAGLDGPTLTKMVQRARKSPEEVLEADGLLETYEAICGVGAAATGVLSMERDASGIFKPKMLAGAEAAAGKRTKRQQALDDALTMATMAARARSEDL